MNQLASEEKVIQPASIGTTWLAERHFYIRRTPNEVTVVFMRLRSDMICYYVSVVMYMTFLRPEKEHLMRYVQAKLENVDYEFAHNSAYEVIRPSLTRASSIEDFDVSVAESIQKYNGSTHDRAIGEFVDAYLKYADRDTRTTL